jgi:hypothetical protein
MAEKHKSKYKEAKDMAKSQKPTTRKDLKDYTLDDKDGGMNPYSTKEMQDLVPRKTDKLVIDDVENMVPEIKHRVYQDVANGKYSPKEAKKIFKKLQIEDTEGYLETREDIDHGVTTSKIKESLSRLTEEQKEKALRKYLRAKIAQTLRAKYLMEQEEVEAPEVEAPEAEIPEIPTEPAPEAPAEPATAEPAPEAPAPEAEAPAEPEEMSPEEKAELEIEKQKKAKKEFLSVLESEKASDTVTHYVELGLEPLLISMKSLSGKKFEMAKLYAKRMIDKAVPSTAKQDKK